jgi:WhiB family redox-sensing transcriptional regulator
MDVLLFFGPGGEPRPEREIREAKAKTVCLSCPVQAQCLAYALGNSIMHGIWGGLNEEERARERRRRARRPDVA